MYKYNIRSSVSVLYIQLNKRSSQRFLEMSLNLPISKFYANSNGSEDQSVESLKVIQIRTGMNFTTANYILSLFDPLGLISTMYDQRTIA